MMDKFAGALLALFYLSGRFSFTGNSREIDGTIFDDVRLWTLFALVGLALMYSAPRTGTLRRPTSISTKLLPVFVLLLQLYVATSCLWSADFGVALVKAQETTILAVASFCIFPWLKAGRAPLVRHWFWISLVAVTASMCLIACARVDATRLSVMGGGPNTFGRNMGLLFLGAIYLQRRSSAMMAWRWYPLMALSLLMVLLSGSRGALLATSVGGFIYLLIDNRYRTRNVLAVAGFLMVTLVVMLSTEIGQQAFEMFETRILNQTVERQYVSGREDLFAAAYELGLERPWFGHGLSGFTILVGHVYPHNLVLELFCETGVVGVLLLAALLLAVTAFVVRNRRHCDPAIWGAFGLALSSAMFSGDFFDSRGVFLMAMLGSQEIVAVRRQAHSHARTPAIARKFSHSYSPAISARH